MTTSIELHACCVECSGELSCFINYFFFRRYSIYHWGFVCLLFNNPDIFSIYLKFSYLLCVFICRFGSAHIYMLQTWDALFFRLCQIFFVCLMYFFLSPDQLRFWWCVQSFIQFLFWPCVCMYVCVFSPYLFRFAAIYFRDLIRFQSQRPNGHHSIRFYRNAFLLKTISNYSRSHIHVHILCSASDLIFRILYHKYTSMFERLACMLIWFWMIKKMCICGERTTEQIEMRKRMLRAMEKNGKTHNSNCGERGCFIDSLKWHGSLRSVII